MQQAVKYKQPTKRTVSISHMQFCQRRKRSRLLAHEIHCEPVIPLPKLCVVHALAVSCDDGLRYPKRDSPTQCHWCTARGGQARETLGREKPSRAMFAPCDAQRPTCDRGLLGVPGGRCHRGGPCVRLFVFCSVSSHFPEAVKEKKNILSLTACPFGLAHWP